MNCEISVLFEFGSLCCLYSLVYLTQSHPHFYDLPISSPVAVTVIDSKFVKQIWFTSCLYEFCPTIILLIRIAALWWAWLFKNRVIFVCILCIDKLSRYVQIFGCFGCLAVLSCWVPFGTATMVFLLHPLIVLRQFGFVSFFGLLSICILSGIGGALSEGSNLTHYIVMRKNFLGSLFQEFFSYNLIIFKYFLQEYLVKGV